MMSDNMIKARPLYCELTSEQRDLIDSVIKREIYPLQRGVDVQVKHFEKRVELEYHHYIAEITWGYEIKDWIPEFTVIVTT